MAIPNRSLKYIRWFQDVGIDDVPIVGGKNASLGEMYREITSQNVRIPNGFATTADSYRYYMSETGLADRIHDIVESLDTNDIENLQECGHRIRMAILETPLPQDFEQEIVSAYQQLCKEHRGLGDVAVRSSATAEDLPDASFAGQQETYLNVRGNSQLLESCRRCMASLFTDRAISYRVDKGFDHFKVALSIGVQQMVRSDVGALGVMFSLDTESGFRDVVLINAAFGLGENVVQGLINPDEIYVFKTTLKSGFRPILKKTLGSKEFKLVYDTGGSKMTKNVPVKQADRTRFAIEDDDILTLARWACVIEDHYSRNKGESCPMDIEWAKDGISGELFIVQARPETIQSQKRMNTIRRYHLQAEHSPIVSGSAVGDRIGQGRVRVVSDIGQLSDFIEGEVLVSDKTDPDWEPVMKKAAAIVTNRGGRTCHAAIVSRELGVPAIVGCNDATSKLKDAQEITISCAEGEIGKVYEGRLDFEVEEINLENIERPKTQIKMNVGDPGQAFELSFLPNDGVGLAREEFIITNYVKIHPLALLDYEQLTDWRVKQQIDELTSAYTNKTQFYIDKLAEGAAMIAAAFYPKEVILRLSDFKTNEYANLIGGQAYEPQEENPMIGFRGASRYYNEHYKRGFELECLAMKKVRIEMGLTNLKLMIPFCRTVEEGKKVLAEMSRYGLVRGEDGLEIYIMCEIPSNVILADEFAEIFDGFSIGSNDLTQLVLGVDRDSEIVAPIFDERNRAVKTMISNVIRTAKEKGSKIGICGQAPSDYPEFARFLVEQGIDSISLTPDAVLKTTLQILEIERELEQSNNLAKK